MPVVRRDTRRRLDQFVANPRCAANVVSAVHDIPMDRVAKHIGLDAKVGQSPFAIQRGLTFERTLYANDAERLSEALTRAAVLPPGSTGFLDLRLKHAGGPMPSLDAARERFEALLRALSPTEAPLSPTLVAGATVQIPGRAILPDGMFAVDVITLHPSEGGLTLRVGEIKVYPDRGGFTDPGELSSARAQAGIYVHGLRLAIDALGLADRIRVADDGFLVLTRPGSNYPSVRAHEDLRWQAERAARAFDRLRAAAAAALPLDAPPDEPVPLPRLLAVVEADKSYDEACLGFCELADDCHARALAAGDAAVLGRDAARFVGSIHLERAVALIGGAAATTLAERDFVRRVAEAGGIA